MNERRSFLSFFGQNKPKSSGKDEKNKILEKKSVKTLEKREFLRFFAYFSAIVRPAFAPVSPTPFRTPRSASPQRKNLRGVLTAIACASFAVLILQLAKTVPFSQSSPFPFVRTPRLTITEQFVRSGEMPKLIITEEAPWFLPWIASKPFSGRVERVELVSPRKDLLKPSFATGTEGAGQTIILEQATQIHPGNYEARVFVRDGTEQLLTRHFRWGVVAVNVRTSLAAPGEHREVHIAVLDDYGRTECQSTVLLKVTDPTGETRDYSTKKGTVMRNPNCRDRSVTNLPDYRALIVPSIPGEYRIGVTASTKDGMRTMVDHFSVGASESVRVTRSAFPTRIYPPAAYPVQFRLTAEKDFLGAFVETVPANFTIRDISDGGTLAVVGEEAGAVQRITWSVKMNEGSSATLGYTFDAPNISPLLYHLGPLSILDDTGEKIFSESRQWQIAADAIKTWDGGAGAVSWSSCNNWDNNTCPVAGDDIVFDGTSNNNATWDSFTLFTSVTSISVTSMSGTMVFARSGQTVTGDFSHTSTGNVTFSQNMTIGGNYTNTTGGTFTPGTTTITMNGTGGKNINTTKTHYNLTIDPSSAATINVVTGSFGVSNTLSVASGDTLAIASGLTLNHNGATLTLDGTISGPGRLTYRSTTAFPTTGTLSGTLILRFDTNDGNQTVSGRTDYGALEFYNKSTSARTITLGSAISQTITTSSYLYVMAESNTGGADTTVSATTNDPVLNVGGDFDFTGTGSTTEIVNPPDAAKDWTVSGNVDLTNGTYNGSAETLKMDGTKNLIGNGQTIANLNINGSSNTVTVTTSDVTIGTLLTVGSNNALSIGSSRTVTLNATSGTTLTLNGTVSGSGTLLYKTSTTFPTAGTISAYLKVDLTNANCSIPARTFGGDLELYNNDAISTRSATLGTGASQTITISGSLYLTAANGAGMTATGATNAPTMNISGTVDYIGAGGGNERIVTGAGTWTVSGNFDIRNGTWSATSGNTITMAGTLNTIYTNTQNFYNFTVDPASTGTITVSGGMGISNTLTVAANDTATVNDYFDLTSTSATSLVLNGTIDGAGIVYYYTSVAFPTTGTMTADVYMYTIVDQSIPGRTFGGDLWIEADNSSLKTLTFGSAGGQTITINGYLEVSALSTANLAVDAATYDPTVSVGAQLDFIGTGSGTEIINAGTGTWTVSGNVNFTDGQYNIETGNTLVMNGTSKTLTSASQTLGNLTLSGSITLANATHTVSGNLSMAGGTITAGTSLVTMTGTSNSITGGGNTLYDLTVDPATAGTITLQTSDLAVSNTLTVAAGDTLSLDASRTLTHTGATLTWGDGTSTISGSGTLRFTDASGGPGTGGVLSAVTRYDASSANVASTTFDARTYGGKVELYASSGTAKTVSCADASTYTVSGASSHLHLFAEGAGDLSLLCDTATDPTVSIGGDLDYQGSGGGSESITTGAGTWTVSGSIDLTGGSITATTGNTVVMDGDSKNLIGNGQTLYKFTINGNGNTVTAATSDVTVSNVLTVGATSDGNNDTLSIASGITVTSSIAGTVTLVDATDTISGVGTLTISNNNLGALGTLSCKVRFDVQGENAVMPARTYGGIVEVYTNATVLTEPQPTLVPAAGTHTLQSHLYLNANNTGTITLVGSTNNPTVTIAGDFDFVGGGAGSEVINTGTNPWTVSGDVNITGGSFTATAGNTFNMNGTSKTLTSASQSFKNFAVTGGSIANADALDVNGTFDVTSGAFTAATEVNMNVSGNFTLASGTTFTGPTGAGILILDGDLTLTDSTAVKQNLGNVQIGTSPDTTNLASDTTYKSLTVTSLDFFYTNGYDIDVNGNITISGTFDATDDVELDETTVNCAGSFTINAGATFVQDQSTLIMDATSLTKDLITDGSFSLYNLTLNDAGGSLTVEVEDPLDVDNTLTITGGTLDTVATENNQINVGGNWDNDDTFTARSGTVVMDAGSGTKTIDADGTGTDAFYALTFNDAAGTATYQLTTAADIDNNLTITGGNFDANSNSMTVGGNWDNDDTFTAGTQTTTFDATSGTKTIDADGTGTEAFSSVAFNDAGGGATWQLTTLMDVDSNLTITSGTFDFNGSNTLSVGGNFTNSDTMVQSTGTLQMDGASGTKTIDTSEAISAAASDYNNITFNDGGGTATYKTIYPLDLDNNLTITGGTFDMTGPTAWYLTNDFYNTEPNYGSWRLKSTDPAGAADNTTICSDGGSGQSGYCTFQPSLENALWNGSAPTNIEQTGWMLNNGIPVNGTIAAGTWTLDTTLNYTSGTCSYGTKRLNARLWKANADLSSPTAISAWSGNVAVSAGVADYTVTFSGISAQTLVNQVLYVEATMRLGSPACGGSTPTTIVFRVNEGGTKQKLTTPAFTPQINLAGSWDNNDLFTHANGVIVFDAGATGKTIEAGSSSFYDATVNNASGGWTVQTDDMTVANNLTLTAGSAWTVASGRTLQVQGTYSQVVAAANTTWTGSTLYLNGSGGMYDINSKTHGGDTYATIRVGASEDIATWDSSATTYTMDAGACLFSEDHAATAGRLNVYGTCNSRSNEYWSYATDFDGAALGGSSRQADVQFASGASHTVDSGDILAILGQTAAANRTLVSRQSSGNYGMTVSGTINAQYYDFDYLDASGLNITSTATVTELSDGTFDNAAAGASSSYITVAGITQTKTFNTNVFDVAADGTDSNVVYNVNADGAGINWTFSDYDGNKGGESFDNETTGATVTWIARPNLTFSVSANSVDLGVINPWAVSTGNHAITVTTTALSGYTCKITEDGNLRNGGNDINDVSGGTVDAGSEEYGINCSGGGCALGSDSVISGTPLTVATSVGPVTNEATTMTYKAAVSAITDALGYSHIVTYTCTGNF